MHHALKSIANSAWNDRSCVLYNAPRDVQSLLFLDLDLGTLNNCALVCARFRRLLRDPLFWRRKFERDERSWKVLIRYTPGVDWRSRYTRQHCANEKRTATDLAKALSPRAGSAGAPVRRVLLLGSNVKSLLYLMLSPNSPFPFVRGHPGPIPGVGAGFSFRIQRTELCVSTLYPDQRQLADPTLRERAWRPLFSSSSAFVFVLRQDALDTARRDLHLILDESFLPTDAPFVLLIRQTAEQGCSGAASSLDGVAHSLGLHDRYRRLRWSVRWLSAETSAAGLVPVLIDTFSWIADCVNEHEK